MKDENETNSSRYINNDGSSAEESGVGDAVCDHIKTPFHTKSCYDNNSARMATSMTTAGILLPDWL